LSFVRMWKLSPSFALFGISLQSSRVIQSFSFPFAPVGSAAASQTAQQMIDTRGDETFLIKLRSPPASSFSNHSTRMLARHFEPRQMCRIHGDHRAQHAARDDVTHKVVIHRHETYEHGNRKNHRYDSSRRHRNHPYSGESENSAGMTRRKTADVVASLKRMKSIRACADQRRIVMRPGLRPIASENVA